MNLLELARPEIRALEPYASARSLADDRGILLNANENPWSPESDDGLSLNRYPDPQPAALVRRMAEYYGIDETRILVTRGSDEGIDLLVRAFCRPGADRVLICPPCFGMYALNARIQGANVVEAPLVEDGHGFALAVDVAERISVCKLAFLCSPNNPTGDMIAADELRVLAQRAAGLVAVDEAYQEFSGRESAATLIRELKNLVVLRTLSKAFALAGCRVGAVLAHADVIALLKRILPPYPLPAPSVAAALKVLTPDGIARMREQVRLLREEKARLCEALESHPAIRRLWPGEANFVLAQVGNAADFVAAAADAGIRLRDQSYQPGLANCVRITIGTEAENDVLLSFISHRSSFISP